jgi:hypothetical protein
MEKLLMPIATVTAMAAGKTATQSTSAGELPAG